MPKWKSALFSDIRNAIGDNVVFTIWKGRPYFRSYVVPANPNTDKQKANRAVLTELVKRYQSLYADDDVKAEWNIEALPYLVSGFNIFVKWGRLSDIKVSPTSGSAPLDVTITYKCGIPLAKARLYQLTGSTWTDITPEAGLLAEGTVLVEDLSAGTYFFFLADVDVLKELDEDEQPYQAITKWSVDEENGVAVECTTVAS
jgi:hypothetical protein